MNKIDVLTDLDLILIITYQLKKDSLTYLYVV